MTYQVTFEQRAGNANRGKIVIVATRDGGDDAQVDLWITLMDPTGAFINEADLSGAADLEVTTPGTITFDIPTASNGDYLQGTYAVMFYEEQTVSDPGNRTLVESESYYFSASPNIGGLSWTPVCVPDVFASLKVTDTGNYTGFTIDRTLTLVHPPVTALANSVSGSASIQAFPTWGNVGYSATLSVDAYKTEDDGNVVWYERYTFTAESTYDFGCTGCDIASCIQEYLEGMEAKLNKGRLAQADYEKMQLITVYHMGYNGAVNCGNNELASQYSTKIKSLLSCSCGCEDETDPYPLTILPELQDLTGETTDWVNFGDDDLSGGWATELFADEQLRWRTVNGTHLEIWGMVQVSTYSSPGDLTLLSGYFEALGVRPEAYVHKAFDYRLNSGSAVSAYGGNMFFAYSGLTETLTLVPNTMTVPSGNVRFSVHALFPLIV